MTRSSLEPCSSSRCGVIIAIRVPTSSTSISEGSAARSIAPARRLSFIPYVASGSYFVRHLEFFRTTSFRWAIAFAAIFAIGMGLLSGIIYWQTARYITRRVDTELRVYAQLAARQPRIEAADPLQHFFESDPEKVKIGGLFDAAGHPLAGNLSQIPAGLPPLGVAGELEIRPGSGTPQVSGLRVLAQR